MFRIGSLSFTNAVLGLYELRSKVAFRYQPFLVGISHLGRGLRLNSGTHTRRKLESTKRCRDTPQAFWDWLA